MLLIITMQEIDIGGFNLHASMRARVFKFCIHLERGQVYYGKENQDAMVNFCFFFHFSFSHSSVIHREICFKDFSGTTVPGYKYWV